MRPRRVHASLVWSDLSEAAVIRWLAHLLHHVFLNVPFGIFCLPGRSARDCSASGATRIGPDRDMAGPNSATRNVSKGDGGYLPLVVRITVGRGDFAEFT